MTDRELLERAAKAAGLPHKWVPMLNRMLHIIDAGNSETWNPLADDGDALRLAVKLGIAITPMACVVQAFVDGVYVATEDLREDPHAATRRAIVRAAAAIGEQA